jgi:hypothetical protein
MTPHEMVTGEKPNLSNFVPFYCPGLYHLTKEERKGKAWNNKAEPCRFLMYDEQTKDSYKLLKVRTGEVVTRMDVVFGRDMDLHDVLMKLLRMTMMILMSLLPC